MIQNLNECPFDIKTCSTYLVFFEKVFRMTINKSFFAWIINKLTFYSYADIFPRHWSWLRINFQSLDQMTFDKKPVKRIV